MAIVTMDTIVSLCKRRGFLFQGSELYGGLQGVWDYGPMGVELKNNVKRAWWRANVYRRDDVEGLDASILMNRLVLKYSGHEATFSDPLVDCRKCKRRFRADHVDRTERCREGGLHDFTEIRPFNLLFKTTVGPVDDAESLAYLRPETAQGIFVNFRNVLDSTSRNLPFGIAQIGKAFRNEITPKNFIFRVREFEQMELEYFVAPGTDEDWHERWIAERVSWYREYGIRDSNLRLYRQKPDELAHYARATTDLLYRFFPEREVEERQFDEIEGIANRTDYDLTGHTKEGTVRFKDGSSMPNEHAVLRQVYFDPAARQTIVPYVIEPSAGVDRVSLAFLMDAYKEETLESGRTRAFLRLHPDLAPVKVAVIPLARNKPDVVAMAKRIKQDLQLRHDSRTMFDNSGNIGKSYARQDEIGTPFCVTVDHQSLDDHQVTIRDRDTTRQDRIAADALFRYLDERLRPASA